MRAVTKNSAMALIATVVLGGDVAYSVAYGQGTLQRRAVDGSTPARSGSMKSSMTVTG